MSWTSLELIAVWNKGLAVKGSDSFLWRQDACGAWMYWNAFGDPESLYGWEIDHVRPVSLGGSAEIANLRPLHWMNKASRLDGANICAVRQNGHLNMLAC